MLLAMPLSWPQIAAANRLHPHLPLWMGTDRALRSLGLSFPIFDLDATLLKVAVVNQLYGTNVYAVGRMAAHIVQVLAQPPDADNRVALVEALADLPPRKHISFASKFAHFFIDLERYPIYDSYAVAMITYHLGRQAEVRDPAHPYWAFVQNLDRLRERAGLACAADELDRYLWLAGLYRAWLRNRQAPINAEVARLFESPPADAAHDIALLWPPLPTLSDSDPVIFDGL